MTAKITSPDLFPIYVRQRSSQGPYKVGYIDSCGELVIEPKFDMGGRFSDGLAPIAIGGKWGFTDAGGNVVIPTRFQNCMEFSEGRAVVIVRRKFGYVDKMGQILIPPQYDSASAFS